MRPSSWPPAPLPPPLRFAGLVGDAAFRTLSSWIDDDAPTQALRWLRCSRSRRPLLIAITVAGLAFGEAALARSTDDCAA